MCKLGLPVDWGYSTTVWDGKNPELIGQLLLMGANAKYIFFSDVGKSSKTKRRLWSSKEASTILKTFHHHVIGETLPGQVECVNAICCNPCLHGRKEGNKKLGGTFS